MKTTKGIEISEAKNISFSNVRLNVLESNPVIDIQSSSSITFNKITVDKDPVMVLRLGGERSGDIQWSGSPLSNKVAFEFGAKENMLKTK